MTKVAVFEHSGRKCENCFTFKYMSFTEERYRISF